MCLQADGTRVRSSGDVEIALSARSIGETMSLDIKRGVDTVRAGVLLLQRRARQPLLRCASFLMTVHKAATYLKLAHTQDVQELKVTVELRAESS